MNKDLHTPGPWVWVGENYLCGGENQGVEILRADDDRRPFGLHSALIRHNDETSIATANADLIASAPALLSALRLLTRRALIDGGVNDPEYQAGKAAIDKATGKTQ